MTVYCVKKILKYLQKDIEGELLRTSDNIGIETSKIETVGTTKRAICMKSSPQAPSTGEDKSMSGLCNNTINRPMIKDKRDQGVFGQKF